MLGTRFFFADLFLDLGAEDLDLHPLVDVRLRVVRFFEEFFVLLFGFEGLGFQFFEFFGDFLVGHRDAHFLRLALQPDRLEQFAQRRFLQFFVFFVAGFGHGFDLGGRGCLDQLVVELRLR